MQGLEDDGQPLHLTPFPLAGSSGGDYGDYGGHGADMDYSDGDEAADLLQYDLETQDLVDALPRGRKKSGGGVRSKKRKESGSATAGSFGGGVA